MDNCIFRHVSDAALTIELCDYYTSASFASDWSMWRIAALAWDKTSTLLLTALGVFSTSLLFNANSLVGFPGELPSEIVLVIFGVVTVFGQAVGNFPSSSSFFGDQANQFPEQNGVWTKNICAQKTCKIIHCALTYNKLLSDIDFNPFLLIVPTAIKVFILYGNTLKYFS